jgi:glycosyltransferase involved in cell wall biosynthesis
MRLSVIIPTYNRGPKLGATLDALLGSDTAGLGEIEIVVVDDGSPTAVAAFVSTRTPALAFSLRCLRQANAGPAAARNTGFRASSGQIVLFMDDDILPSPQLLSQHVEAHRIRPGCAIFGSCPFLQPQPSTLLFQYIEESPHFSPAKAQSEDFVKCPIVASGQLSVERELFDPVQGVYSDGLTTPAAEEYELSLRLQQRGIPILHALRIVAWHDQPISIESLCRQQYKHAVGCAEAAIKYPATLELPELRKIIAANGPPSRGDSLKQVIKRVLKRFAMMPPVYAGLLRLVKWAEIVVPRKPVLRPLYTAVIGAHFCAGLRDGLKKYAGHRAAMSDHSLMGASCRSGCPPVSAVGGLESPE